MHFNVVIFKDRELPLVRKKGLSSRSGIRDARISLVESSLSTSFGGVPQLIQGSEERDRNNFCTHWNSDRHEAEWEAKEPLARNNGDILAHGCQDFKALKTTVEEEP